MPSRKRHRSTPTAHSVAPDRRPSPAATADPADAVERFAAALKESERREKAERERKAKEKADADRRAAEKAAHADALGSAKRDLERAIEAVRAAKANGRGRAEADAAWKAAKARVVELETGERPAWAPVPPAATDEVPDEMNDAPADAEPAADAPDDDQ